jgi:hypothetical protein
MEAHGEIGGYFGLDLTDYDEESPHPEAIRYQSARAAIHAALSCNGFTRVLLPDYVCNSVFQAAADAGLTVDTYDLDESLYPRNLSNSLPPHCALLYVDYFGLCQHNVRRLLERMPPGLTIVDNSQALFCAPNSRALATVYSPRKFAGLPDGGLLVASKHLRIAPPTEEDQGSFDRMRFLLQRMAYSAREGYTDFSTARLSLINTSPLAMSRLTRRVMRSIRWDDVKRRRCDNYATMDAMFKGINDFPLSLRDEGAPLCYPLILRGRNLGAIRSALADQDIFIPVYWPDALSRAKAGSVEEILINETLFLPIDQRMSRIQVEEVCKRVLQLTGMN